MKKFLLIAFVAALSITSLQGRGRGKVTTLDETDFRSLTLGDTTITLVDMRPPQQFCRGHIKGARNVYSRGRREDCRRMADMGGKRPMAIYCKNGAKSYHTARRIAKRGRRVYHLNGGYDSWRRKGQPVVKGREC